MRKFLFGVTAAVALAVAPAAAGVAGAAPTPNAHNCVGVADSGFAGPGFGAVVSGIARSMPGAIAASLGPFANCGHAPGVNSR